MYVVTKLQTITHLAYKVCSTGFPIEDLGPTGPGGKHDSHPDQPPVFQPCRGSREETQDSQGPYHRQQFARKEAEYRSAGEEVEQDVGLVQQGERDAHGCG